MNNLQKVGGVAALIEALAYIIGFTVMLTLLSPDNAAALDSTQKLAFLLGKKEIFQVLNLIIYVVFGVFLVVLALALHERLKAGSPALVQTATVFGLIWAGLVIASGMIANIGLDTVAKVYAKNPDQATSIWLAVASVQDGLGGGVELVGGLWVLLISWAALRCAGLPKALNYVGVVVGAAGLLTLVPGLGELGAVFGLGQIVWFVWLGIYLLRNSKSH